MLKKTITYTDYNGNQQTDDFYFSLNEADLIDMEVEASEYSTPDDNGDTGYKAMLNAIIKAQDAKALMRIFKDLIRRSYGVKTADGKHFYKGDEVYNDFVSSPAYSQLILDLLTNTEHATEFANGVFPRNLLTQLEVVSGGNTSNE